MFGQPLKPEKGQQQTSEIFGVAAFFSKLFLHEDLKLLVAFLAFFQSITRTEPA